MDARLKQVLDDVAAGERLSAADAIQLLESHDLASIGRAAHAVTQRLHPEPYRTYNIDRNINYTNICTAVCDFCAFYRGPKHPEGYVLDREVLLKKILGGGGGNIDIYTHPKPPFRRPLDMKALCVCTVGGGYMLYNAKRHTAICSVSRPYLDLVYIRRHRV